jgi:hypothetical protein
MVLYLVGLVVPNLAYFSLFGTFIKTNLAKPATHFKIEVNDNAAPRKRQLRSHNKRTSHHAAKVARFFLVRDTKTGKNVPNEHKMYQIFIKYPKYQ